VMATDGAYRTAGNADNYKKNIGAFVGQGKPAAITEFGCGTYTGAADNAANSLWIIDWVDGRPERLNGNYDRNESEQASYMLELLKIFEAEKVDAAFTTSFASYSLPHRKDPLRDLDIGSYGIVKVYQDKFGETYPDMPWEPKESFRVLANYFKA